MVSKAKTVVLHSKLSQLGKRRIAKAMERLGVGVVRHTKLLGVDFSAGKKVKRSVQRARIARVCSRRRRYRQVGGKAARQLVKTGAGPGFRYGSAAYGATNSAIKAVRSFSCNAIGEMRGKSTFARLTLANYDAGGLMAIDPIVHWARAVFDKLVSQDDMRISWQAAMVKVAGAERPFGAVCGPAGAMVASAMRIGWKIPSPFHVLMEEGTLVSLDNITPSDLQLLAARALRHKEAPLSSLAQRTGVTPDLEPLRSFLGTIRRTKAAASLRALGEGGWWTQARMFGAGLAGVDDDVCKVCHDQVGDLYHGQL